MPLPKWWLFYLGLNMLLKQDETKNLCSRTVTSDLCAVTVLEDIQWYDSLFGDTLDGFWYLFWVTYWLSSVNYLKNTYMIYVVTT